MSIVAVTGVDGTAVLMTLTMSSARVLSVTEAEAAMVVVLVEVVAVKTAPELTVVGAAVVVLSLLSVAARTRRTSFIGLPKRSIGCVYRGRCRYCAVEELFENDDVVSASLFSVFDFVRI